MGVKEIFDNAVDFGKDKIDEAMSYWDDLDEDKQKLFIGCAVVVVSVIVIASVFYALGKKSGRRAALYDDDFF